MHRTGLETAKVIHKISASAIVNARIAVKAINVEDALCP